MLDGGAGKRARRYVRNAVGYDYHLGVAEIFAKDRAEAEKVLTRARSE